MAYIPVADRNKNTGQAPGNLTQKQPDGSIASVQIPMLPVKQAPIIGNDAPGALNLVTKTSTPMTIQGGGTLDLAKKLFVTPVNVRPPFAKAGEEAPAPAPGLIGGAVVDLASRILELVPRVTAVTLANFKSAADTIANKPNTGIKLSFDASRLGLPEGDTVTDTASRMIDDFNKREEKKPNAPTNILMSVLTVPIMDVLDVAGAGDIVSAGSRQVLKVTQFDPVLDGALQKLALKGKTVDLDTLKAAFVKRGTNIIQSNGGNMSGQTINQLDELGTAVNTVVTNLRGKGVPQLNKLGNFMQDVALTLNQDVRGGFSFGAPKFAPIGENVVPATGSRSLPGYRDVPGQAPAFGLSIRKTEPVGFGDESQPLRGGGTYKNVEARRLDTAAQNIIDAPTTADRRKLLADLSSDDIRAIAKSEKGNQIFKLMEEDLSPAELKAMSGEGSADTRIATGAQTTESNTELVARERFKIPELKKISFGGSDRDVYDLGDGKVLKIAKSARGLAQNDAGVDYYAQNAELIPKTYETGKNYIVSDKVMPPDAKTRKMVADFKKELADAGYDQESVKDAINAMAAKSEYEDLYNWGDLLNYDPMWNDLAAVRNWGTTSAGKPILLDEGTLNNNIISEYGFSNTKQRKLTNMDSEDFRDVHARSRAAKKEHGDTDSKTMYKYAKDFSESDVAKAARKEGFEFDLTLDEAKAEAEKLFDKNEIDFLFPDSLIKLDKKSEAWGLYDPSIARSNPLIQVVSDAGKVSSDVLYHESFHAYMDNFVESAERRQILDSVRRNIGTFFARGSKVLDGYSGGDEIAEEWLADDFAKWMKDQKHATAYKSFYQKIVAKVRSWIRKISKLEDIYRRISEKRRPARPRSQVRKLTVRSAKRAQAPPGDEDPADIAARAEKDLEEIDQGLAEYNKLSTIEPPETAYRFKQLPEEAQQYLLANNLVPEHVAQQAVLGMTESDIIEASTPHASTFMDIRAGGSSKKIGYKELDGELKALREEIGRGEFGQFFRKIKTGDRNRMMDEFATDEGFSDLGTGGDTQAFRDELIDFVEKRKEIKRTFNIQRALERAEKAADKAKIAEIKDIENRVYNEITKKRYSNLQKAGFEQKALAIGKTRGIREGKKIGWREAKTSITNQLRNTFDVTIESLERKGELDAFRTKIIERTKARIRQELVDYARENLPQKDRGRLLTMAAQADSQRDLIKAFTRIDAAADEVRRKSAIAELTKKLQTVKDSGQVAIDYKERIQDLVSGFEFKNRRADTIERLKRMQEFVDTQRAAGKDVTIPEQILKSLEILKRKPVKDLKLSEIATISETVDMLEQLGRTKLATRERLYELQKEKWTSELVNAIRPIEKHQLFVPKPGEKITMKQKFKNVFPTVLNMAQHTDLSLTPMDVFFDLLGGSPGTYDSAPSRIFKGITDRNYGAYTDMRDEIVNRVWETADRLNMTQQNFERIGVHAARVQKDGMEKLLNSGLTREDIDAIILTPEEMEMYQTFRNELDGLRDPIDQVMRTVYNKPLGKVENYFSFMTDWESMSDTEVFQRIGQDVPEFGKPRKNVEQGFTKERTGAGQQKIKVDAMEIFAKHVDNAAYLVNMGRDNRMLFEIANSKEFGAAAGDVGQNYTLQWLDLIARKGGKDGDARIAWLDALRRNLGVATLGFKLSSALIQPTALLDGASEIGSWAFKGVTETTLSRDTRQFIMYHFPEIRARVGDDPAYLDMGKNDTLNTIRNASYAGLKMLDKWAAAGTGWGAYIKKLDELGVSIRVLEQPKDLPRGSKIPPGAIYTRKDGSVLDMKEIQDLHAKAIEYAQKVVRNTQSSAIYKDLPLALSRGQFSGNKSLDKALFQFQSFTLRRWFRIRHDLYRAGLKNRNFAKAYRIFFYLSIAFLAEEGLRRASTELVDLVTGHETKQQDGYTTAVAKNALGTIPFVSQGISIATYQTDPIPALGALQTGVGGGVQAFTGASDQSRAKGLVDLTSTLGAISGIPGSRQAAQVTKNLIGDAPKKSKGILPGAGIPKLPKLPKLPKIGI